MFLPESYSGFIVSLIGWAKTGHLPAKMVHHNRHQINADFCIPKLFSVLLIISTCSAFNNYSETRFLRENSACNWPIDLSLERDGTYQHRQAKNVAGSMRGRSGNTIIQYMAFRLNAASYGGFAYPWTGLIGMEEGNDKGDKSVEVWGPRFGKLASCRDIGRNPSIDCPKSTGEISSTKNPLPKSTAAQKCAADDDKFHQVLIRIHSQLRKTSLKL